MRARLAGSVAGFGMVEGISEGDFASYLPCDGYVDFVKQMKEI
jgi:hypothetical protein